MSTTRARFAFALALQIVAFSAALAEPGRRVALVVGVGQYRNVPALENPKNDARLIADTLRRLGFVLVGGGPRLDLDKPSFDQAIQAFGNELVGAEIGLFYYAGHGLQVQGTNWLVPTGANPAKSQDLDFQMVDLGLVLRQMEGSGTRLNILILDACRNNPFGNRGMRAAEGGLAQMRAPEGTLIAYATQPGNVALDGASGSSPFSSALARALSQPGLDVFRLFNQVGVDVKRATGGQQQPWLSSSPIDGDFFFMPSSEPLAPPSAVLARSGDPAKPMRDPVPARPDPMRAVQEGEAAESRNDFATAFAWYNRAASLGSRDAAFDLGWLYQKGLGRPPDSTQAAQWYRRAAEAGHAMAANNLGVLYKNGMGVERDYSEALRWYRFAAEAGNVDAQNNLGVMFNNGLGVMRDDDQALRWFRRAADAGNASAQVNIGILYKNGSGVAQNFAEAIAWFRRAADAGSEAGMLNLGLLYENGLGVPRDHVQAVAWLRKAAANGSDAATTLLLTIAQ